MTPEDYNARELAAGRLTWRQITTAIRSFQDRADVEQDGRAGPVTRAMLDAAAGEVSRSQLISDLLALQRVWPLRCLANGRKPEVTSGHYSRNKSRPNHRGVDLFFRHLDDDPPDARRGDGFGTGVDADGTVKWWIPPGTHAVASADGVVSLAGESPTGYRVWIDVGPAYDGYFHLDSLLVKPGDRVAMGDALGVVGDNPKDIDAAHLHFEIYVGDLARYQYETDNSFDPQVYLERALYLSAT